MPPPPDRPVTQVFEFGCVGDTQSINPIWD